MPDTHPTYQARSLRIMTWAHNTMSSRLEHILVVDGIDIASRTWFPLCANSISSASGVIAPIKGSRNASTGSTGDAGFCGMMSACWCRLERMLSSAYLNSLLEPYMSQPQTKTEDIHQLTSNLSL
ncbi:hypothetical protein VTK73DRAFT_2728 [Phialemonium thermophilum]|uniref:Uncharacterized protein n=1 Tax=Phialemonium thermophilum TaxID=223376 RepID=A0ABR3VPT2_9PEZI